MGQERIFRCNLVSPFQFVLGNEEEDQSLLCKVARVGVQHPTLTSFLSQFLRQTLVRDAHERDKGMFLVIGALEIASHHKLVALEGDCLILISLLAFETGVCAADTCVCFQLCLRGCVFVCVCVCVRACKRVRICVSVSSCLRACVPAYLRVCTCTCVHVYVRASVCEHVRACVSHSARA